MKLIVEAPAGWLAPQSEIPNAIDGRGVDRGRRSIDFRHPRKFVALCLGVQTI
ncbi:hypothetical protein OZ411_02440 [Bradyrhizobium sp. Arg237L]|uniref:hypothetical protein n=1 Tax=Bradyrhizobium sp. Arg237L TaxID=3003352 RepID=UPI00249DD365|nr:hypothetical protein [Bradyrhizobium sp. Arg237L]MDI4231670.1 hypothetical protein [Bradyrhizobium sp. Arg237L]